MNDEAMAHWWAVELKTKISVSSLEHVSRYVYYNWKLVVIACRFFSKKKKFVTRSSLKVSHRRHGYNSWGDG